MFKRIYLEISNICNLQCSFCPEVEREKKILSPEDLKKILSQIAPLTEEVCLHLMGEPLGHKDFDQMLFLCDENKVATQITTNGLLLQGRRASLLASTYLRQINFSVQSFKDNFPSRSLKEYLGTIVSFTKDLHKTRPEVYVNFRLWNIGRSERNENEEVFALLEEFYQIKINRQIQVDSIKSKRIWNRVYLHFDSDFQWPSLKLPYQGEVGRCHALTQHIGIHADGTVVPCCLDKEAQIPLGNCLKEDIREILVSPKALAMKKGFQNSTLVEKLCQHCTYIKRF